MKHRAHKFTEVVLTDEELDTLVRALEEYEDQLRDNPHQFGFDNTEEDALAEMVCIAGIRKQFDMK